QEFYEKKSGWQPVPLLVEQCVDFIRTRGLTEEGLFRLPGQANLVKDLQDSFDGGKKPQFDRFLDEVQSYASHNKMSIQNLATVFGPNILRPQVEDPVAQMEGTSLVQGLMAILISEHAKIFDPSLIQDSVQPDADLQCPPSWVDWNLQSGQTENSLCSHAGSLPALGPSAAQPRMQDCNQKGNGQQPPSSPNHRKQGLASWKGSPLRQPGTRSLYHPPGSPFLESCCLSLHENGLLGGRSAVQGHRGGKGKGSDSHQRLSAYDNVPILHRSKEACSNAGPSGSLSSSSLSLAVDSVTPCATCTTTTRACLALSPLGSPLPHDEVSLGSNGGEPETGCGRSREGRHLSVASRDAVHCSEALQDLIAELKAELRKQRSGYEAAFKRMEGTSTELRKLVTRLQEELIQGKKKEAVLQIKLRNSERARKDAERRNRFLQEEMEYFFTTLGNITAGSHV
uniref:Rho GTPase activating protein 22 n=1 Tax=Pseudonaja textilis TaxID=8673 RepID=A0A670ZT22_PSETE